MSPTPTCWSTTNSRHQLPEWSILPVLLYISRLSGMTLKNHLMIKSVDLSLRVSPLFPLVFHFSPTRFPLLTPSFALISSLRRCPPLSIYANVIPPSTRHSLCPLHAVYLPIRTSTHHQIFTSSLAVSLNAWVCLGSCRCLGSRTPMPSFSSACERGSVRQVSYARIHNATEVTSTPWVVQIGRLEMWCGSLSCLSGRRRLARATTGGCS
ncbi:hypothetical protein QBC35DRAFT_243537 [Podospora australis]|uniref:Uncharacterized protein n=1 Tax=Podospora australis TaxID=1536484 RepID=A0AAN6X2M2_9PEZI|nr:hypothetical protein QBC35DRAFT_243537 [Podospora australis]